MNTMSSAAPASPVAARDVATGNIDQIDQIDAVDEAFYALVYSDPQWLRAEFEAIVAADSSGSTPPSIPSPHGGAEHPERGHGPEPSKVTTRHGLGGHTIRGRGARTRSPPDNPLQRPELPAPTGQPAAVVPADAAGTTRPCGNGQVPTAQHLKRLATARGIPPAVGTMALGARLCDRRGEVSSALTSPGEGAALCDGRSRRASALDN